MGIEAKDNESNKRFLREQQVPKIQQSREELHNGEYIGRNYWNVGRNRSRNSDANCLSNRTLMDSLMDDLKETKIGEDYPEPKLTIEEMMDDDSDDFTEDGTIKSDWTGAEY